MKRSRIGQFMALVRVRTSVWSIAYLGLAAVALGGASQAPRQRSSAAQSSTSLPNFAFHDQRGQLVTRRDLLGHVWIADLIYTSCQSACPLLTARLVTLQRRLRDPGLRFVSFSVDPHADTPAALAEYAKRWNASEARWQLLSTDASGLAQLTSSLQVAVSGSGSEIVHSDRFFLIDAQGSIVDRFDSADDAALERLLGTASQLLGSAPRAAIDEQSGAELFAALGCHGCHDDSRLAPPLAGLAGTRVMLERGGNALADDTYLRASIATPAAQVVAGYPNSMPAYGSLLTSAQLDALVGYVRALAGSPQPDPAAAATVETDPVCGMSVRATKDTPTRDFQGRTYHFCSLVCAQHFRANPHKYAPEN